jgi:hypothetical protein
MVPNKMAACNSHEGIASEVLKHVNVDQSSVSCLNCELMEKQLQSALSELKLAERIISMLREDSIGITTRQTADQQARASSCEPSDSECGISAHGQASETRITVARKNKDRKMTYGISATNNR